MAEFAELPSPADARMIRIEAGLSQAELAIRIRCSTMTVNRYEMGRTVLNELISHRYAVVLNELQNTPPAWLAVER